MDWIRVDERLPQVHQDVLLWTIGEQAVQVGWRAEGDAFATWNEPCADVSHWMPLPERPTEARY